MTDELDSVSRQDAGRFPFLKRARRRLVELIGPEASLRGQLIRGAGGSLVLKVTDAALGLAVSLVLARALKPEGLGIYSFALSVVGLLGVPVMMGLPSLVVREVARYHVAGEWALLRGVLTRAAQVMVVLSAVIGPIAAAVVWARSDQIDPAQSETLMWALILLPLLSLNRLREASLLGLGRVFQALAPERLFSPVAMLLAIGAYMVTGELGPPEAMALNCMATTLVFLLGARFLARSVPSEVRGTRPKYDNGVWTRSLIPLSLLAGLNVIVSQTDLFMLGLLSTKADVGLYRVAFSGAALVLFFYAALNMVLMPHFARLYNAGDMERLQRLITTATRSVFASALPIAGAFVLFGGGILELVYGSAYRPAYLTLAILSGAQLFNVFTGSVYDALNMSGHERDTMKGVVLSAAANVVLNWLLIPHYGSTGAAIATSMSILLVNMSLVRMLWVKTSLWSPAFGRTLVSGRTR